MLRKPIILLITTLLATAARADIAGDWKVYNTFDNNVLKIVDTPTRVYFQTLAQPHNTAFKTFSTPYPFLFVYDKEGDELAGYNKRNYLSENIVNQMEYNPDKGYLLLVYDNGNIDLMEDDGTVRNVPGLMDASLASSKGVNGVSFDAENNRAYVATDFGYITIDDKKGEIDEARVYNKKCTAVARVGDNLLFCSDDGVYVAPLDANKMSFSAFTKIFDKGNITHVLPLEGNKFAVRIPVSTSIYRIATGEVNGTSALTLSNLRLSDNVTTAISSTQDGYLYSTPSGLFHLSKAGELSPIAVEEEDTGLAAASRDLKEFWFGRPREGFSSKRLDGSTWTVTRADMLPNAPSVFIGQEMEYSEEYGMIVAGHSINRNFTEYNIYEPILISGLKDGEWIHYAPAYTNPTFTTVLKAPNGVSIDPENPNYAYIGSYASGIARIDLADPNPQSILHMGQPYSEQGLPGFKQLVVDGTSPSFCIFSAPKFDADGNLWTTLHRSQLNSKEGHIWVWPSKFKNATDMRGWITFTPTNYVSNGYQFILPLKSSVNKNLVLVVPHIWSGPIWIIDHKGTLENTSDDTYVQMDRIYDQDGSEVVKKVIYSLYEDPQTGQVWASTFNGVFTFFPQEALQNPSRVSRIKVSRNDGTNLADYLLDNVGVNCMAPDAMGRKWFALNGGGIVVTSSDGKEVLGQFTTDNSYLPSNYVYGIGYNPDTNSMMIATGNGLAEFFCSGSASTSDMDSARAYPNPVRPDYLGYVTIDGLVDNALVKIMDSAGNLVKELGLASGGATRWDVTNLNGNRVRSGVYYVCASSGPGDANMAKVTKILVVN